MEALQPGTVDPPGHPRRLRKRLTWLFLRPAAGRLRADTADERDPDRRRGYPAAMEYASSILDLVGNTPLVRDLAA